MESPDLESRLRRELASIRKEPATQDDWTTVQKRRRRRAVSRPIVMGAATVAVLLVAIITRGPKGTETRLVASPTPAQTPAPPASSALPPPPEHGPDIPLAAPLPAEGIVIEEKGAVKLLSLDGRLTQRLEGMSILHPVELPSGPVVLERKSDGARFIVEGRAIALRTWFSGW